MILIIAGGAQQAATWASFNGIKNKDWIYVYSIENIIGIRYESCKFVRTGTWFNYSERVEAILQFLQTRGVGELQNDSMRLPAPIGSYNSSKKIEDLEELLVKERSKIKRKPLDVVWLDESKKIDECVIKAMTSKKINPKYERYYKYGIDWAKPDKSS